MKRIGWVWAACWLIGVTNVAAQQWVEAVVPAPHSQQVAVTSAIEIRFDRPVQVPGIVEAPAWVYSPAVGFVETSWGYNPDTQTFMLTPREALPAGALVTVSVPVVLSDNSGAVMPQPYVWQFTTATQGQGMAFAVQQTVSVGAVPYGVVAGDWDNDGDIDLATSNRNVSTVSLLMNDGSGSFEVVGTVSVGNLPEYIIAADIERDGDLDLATANRGFDNVSLLENDGTGTFQQVATVRVGSRPHTINANDVDGDGDQDFVVSNFAAGTMSVLHNDGRGGFTPGDATPRAGSGPEVGLLHDLDGDGDLDLATSNFSSGTVSVWSNDGKGGFGSSSTLSVGRSPHLSHAADLDGDQDIDFIATVSGSGQVVTLFNDGAGVFSDRSTLSLAGSPWAATSGDFNADGAIDVAVTRYGAGSVSILENDGTGTLTQAASVNVGTRPHVLVTSDFDNDGDLDLAVANDGSNSVSILLNTSAMPTSREQEELPAETALFMAYPNPFASAATVRLELGQSKRVQVAIYDVLGRRVDVLADQEVPAGMQEWNWTADAVPAGVYFVRLTHGLATETQVLIKQR